MSNSFPLQQYRLNTGEEVICEIMEWEDEANEILVRNAMVIEQGFVDESMHNRMYAFRPWMLYIEKPHEIIVLNTESVVANCKPNDLLALQYYEAVRDMSTIADDRVQDHNKREAMKLKAMVEQIAELKKEGKERADLPDNVIQFPEKDTIH